MDNTITKWRGFICDSAANYKSKIEFIQCCFLCFEMQTQVSVNDVEEIHGVYFLQEKKCLFESEV